MQRARAVEGGLFLAVYAYLTRVHPCLPEFFSKLQLYAVVRICECVSHAHPLFRTLAHTWVCVSCPGVTVEKSPLQGLVPSQPVGGGDFMEIMLKSCSMKSMSLVI